MSSRHLLPRLLNRVYIHRIQLAGMRTDLPHSHALIYSEYFSSKKGLGGGLFLRRLTVLTITGPISGSRFLNYLTGFSVAIIRGTITVLTAELIE
jgi:hypothetical protein